MATIDARYYWLVVIAALNSVISFVYYGGVIKRMFLEEGVNQQPIVLPRLSNALLGVLGIAVIVMGLYWGPLRNIRKSLPACFFVPLRLPKKSKNQIPQFRERHGANAELAVASCKLFHYLEFISSPLDCASHLTYSEASIRTHDSC